MRMILWMIFLSRQTLPSGARRFVIPGGSIQERSGFTFKCPFEVSCSQEWMVSRKISKYNFTELFRINRLQKRYV